MKQFNNETMKQGFTLVEIVVTIFIVVLLTGIILASYRGTEKQFALQRSANKLAQDIRGAQEMAMSMKEYNLMNPSGGYGIYFTTGTPGSYILFADCDGEYDYDPGGTCGGKPEKIGKDIEFESGVEIGSLSPSPLELTITFTPPDPVVRINGSAASSLAGITLVIDSTTRNVTVNTAGLIDID